MKIALFSLFIMIAFGGCTFRYTDAQGCENTMGLLWITHTKTQKPLILQMRSLGLGVNVGPKGAGLQVGYRETVDVIPSPEDKTLSIKYYPGNPFEAEVEESSVNDMELNVPAPDNE